MKEVAPGASLTDGKRTTRLFLTDSETGNASEKQGGSPSKKEAGLIRPFSFVSFSINFVFELSFPSAFQTSLGTNPYPCSPSNPGSFHTAVSS